MKCFKQSLMNAINDWKRCSIDPILCYFCLFMELTNEDWFSNSFMFNPSLIAQSHRVLFQMKNCLISVHEFNDLNLSILFVELRPLIWFMQIVREYFYNRRKQINKFSQKPESGVEKIIYWSIFDRLVYIFFNQMY